MNTRMLRGLCSAFAVPVLTVSGLLALPASTAHAQDTTVVQTAPIPSAPAGETLLKTKLVNDTDRLTQFVSTKATPAPLPSGTSARSAKHCQYVTATAVYDAPVGRLWSYTSSAVWCGTHTRVTDLYWQAPDWTITDKGTLAGWHYKGHSKNTHVLTRRLRTGDDVGHFKRYYKACVIKCVTVDLGSQDAPHHLWVKVAKSGKMKHGWS